MPSGIITKGIGGFYYVASGDDIYECRARGIFRKDEIVPLVGDNVIFAVTDHEKKKGSIDQISERSSLLTRPAVANVNQLIAVIAARSPDPDLLLLDKLLVTAEKTGIGAAVCINKTDLDKTGEKDIYRDIYRKAGYTVLETSSKENTGFEELMAVLKGHVTVFAGQSGVGKSTIMNRLMNTTVMKTGGLSDKIGRGKHTTRHAELIRLEYGGYIADTPGFSSFELMNINYMELQYLFPEFGNDPEACRFTGCSHISEPGCKVKQAVQAGNISQSRYDHYIELYNALKLEDSRKYKK